MFRKLRFTFRRLVTMSNILENLLEVYGDREVMCFSSPLGYRRFPGRGLANSDCVLFTNLAAEAFIRELDLKKGERVLLCMSDERETLLLALAVIKAGGIAVPLSGDIPWGEAREYAAGCYAGLAIVDSASYLERLGGRRDIPGVERWMVAGPRDQAPGDIASLDEAMDSSSGFFIPYTLKPGNVVGLFPSSRGRDKPKAVMVTNQGLLGTQRAAALILPLGPGNLAYLGLPLSRAAGFASSVVGLCAGAALFAPDGGGCDIARSLAESGCDVFLGVSYTYAALLEEGREDYDLSSIRLWVDASPGLSRSHIDELERLGSQRLRRLKPPAVYSGLYGIPETAGIMAIRPAISGWSLPRGCMGITLPPARIKVVDERGRVARSGDTGELLVRGPNTTPGYWNDLEETLRMKSGSWLHTGISARRSRLLVYADIDESRASL
ncbi:MAG: AMP-binding protein [Actinomycetota bacterium]|nr:AMP-binding protein [Actinomycetota bacterium]